MTRHSLDLWDTVVDDHGRQRVANVRLSGMIVGRVVDLSPAVPPWDDEGEKSYRAERFEGGQWQDLGVFDLLNNAIRKVLEPPRR